MRIRTKLPWIAILVCAVVARLAGAADTVTQFENKKVGMPGG